MLFRFLIIVSLLLASVEGAPINIRRHHSWTKHTIPAGHTNHLLVGPCSTTCGIGTRVVYSTRGCLNGQDKCFLFNEQCKGAEDCGLDGIVPPKIPWKKVIYSAVIIFLLGTLIGAISYTRHRHLKKDKPRRNDESTTDGDRETNANPIGNHEDAPMAKKRDDLENTNSSTPSKLHITISMETFKNVIVPAFRKYSDASKNVTDDALHEPMVEKRDGLDSTMISMPADSDEETNMSPDENAVATSGPMVEKSDSLDTTMFPMPTDSEEEIFMSLDEDRVTASDKQEDEKHILPPLPVSSITPQVSDIWAEPNTRLSQNQE